MTSIPAIALSGINSASLRIATGANNIVNAVSTTSKSGGPYIPQDVIQVPNILGGTIATVVDSDKPPVMLYDPTNADADANGIVSLPNIDLAAELVKIDEAAFQFKAALKMLEGQRNLGDSLLDVFV
jgi:flagellar basal-body rod protein FlgC